MSKGALKCGQPNLAQLFSAAVAQPPSGTQMAVETTRGLLPELRVVRGFFACSGCELTEAALKLIGTLAIAFAVTCGYQEEIPTPEPTASTTVPTQACPFLPGDAPSAFAPRSEYARSVTVRGSSG